MTTQTKVRSTEEALELAFKALDIVKIHYTQNRHVNEAITAIKEALAQPEQRSVSEQQEPVGHGGRPMTLRECMEAEEPNQALEIPDCGEAGHADGACGTRDCLPSFKRYATPPQRSVSEYLKTVAWNGDCVLGHCGSPAGCEASNCCRADYTTPPQPQSEARGLSQSKPLTFDEVEGCFPDGGGTNEYGEAVVSAQWLHDFAAAVQRAAHGITASEAEDSAKGDV